MPDPVTHPAESTPGPLLIFGCGYVGLRVALQERQTGRTVYALTRRRAEWLAQQGILPLSGDVLVPESLPPFPAEATVLYAVGYDRFCGRSMREVYLHGLEHVLERLPVPRRFVYLSSTSVYGQCDGSWVDEDSPAEPSDESGRVVRDAELLLRHRLPHAIILRSAGIYGPNRLLRRREQLLQNEPIPGDPHRWLNLIHVDDLVAAICLAMDQSLPAALYNVVDDTPVTRQEFYTLLAELYGAPPPRFADLPEPRANHRRIRNSRLRHALHWEPRYPSIREGLPAALAASES
jgi:nucleoside-diphosphate-sugar epimerase